LTGTTTTPSCRSTSPWRSSTATIGRFDFEALLIPGRCADRYQTRVRQFLGLWVLVQAVYGDEAEAACAALPQDCHGDAGWSSYGLLRLAADVVLSYDIAAYYIIAEEDLTKSAKSEEIFEEDTYYFIW
jgi:hypothetical protein